MKLTHWTNSITFTARSPNIQTLSTQLLIEMFPCVGGGLFAGFPVLFLLFLLLFFYPHFQPLPGQT